MANMKCPICKGKGKILEDALQYEFVTRDAINSTCLYCMGFGVISPNKKLPDGRKAHEIKIDTPGPSPKTRLNVSKKAVVNTGVGYKADSGDNNGIAGTASCATSKSSASEKRRGRPKKAEGKDANALIIPSYLRKVLESGKRFLVITESDPYYLVVCMEIRKLQIKRKDWSAHDEEGYIKALEDAVLRQMEVSNG